MGFSQHVTYGLVAGTALTNDFNTFVYNSLSLGQTFQLVQKDGGRSIIAGPTVEWNIFHRFSVEGSALFRELHLVNVGGPRDATVTWEFPILAKYRFSSYGMGSSAIRPFVEAGPSFRTTGNLNAFPSHRGISAGGGLDLRIQKFAVSPTLRYTRWAADNITDGIRSKSDQLELLVGFSYSPESSRHLFGERVSVGVILGTNLLNDYTGTSFSGLAYTGTEEVPYSFSSSSGPHNFSIGPAIELHATSWLSLEVDAIHKPASQLSTNVLGSFTASSKYKATTWQLPLLAKYKPSLAIPGHALQPFIEAGPSFRLPTGITNYGFTAGFGVAHNFRRMSISPALRYTGWQSDRANNNKPDQLDLLVGLTF